MTKHAEAVAALIGRRIVDIRNWKPRSMNDEDTVAIAGDIVLDDGTVIEVWDEFITIKTRARPSL